MKKLWQQDKKLGQNGSVNGSLSNLEASAKSVTRLKIWRLTALTQEAKDTTESAQIAELLSTFVSGESLTSNCSVVPVTQERRTTTALLANLGHSRWLRGQMVILFDELDFTVDEIYRSGLQCRLCFGSCIWLDIYCPSENEKGGELGD